MPDPTTPAPSDLLTITEAAEMLRAPVATLRYWRHLGTGPDSFRLGRRVLYRRDDLDAWITAQHDRALQPAAELPATGGTSAHAAPALTAAERRAPRSA